MTLTQNILSLQNNLFKNLKLKKMLYVKITEEEALKIGSRNYGLTSERNKETKEKKTIYFCDNLTFIKNFDREKEFINI